MPDLQISHPDIGVGYDIDPAEAVQTRRRILDIAATDSLLIAGMHLHFPAFAHIGRQNGTFQIIPEPWQPVVGPASVPSV